VLVDVDVSRPGLYRIVYRYVNPGDDVTGDVTVTSSEGSDDVTQQSQVTLVGGAIEPLFTSASQGGVVTTFVLNPGPLTVGLKCPPGVLVVRRAVSSLKCTHTHTRLTALCLGLPG